MIPSETELHYYYFGLYTTLKRYRFATILGWLIVGLGLSSIPLGWEWGRPHGVLDFALGFMTIVAGLVLVYHSVVHLESYLRVPFPIAVTPEGTPEVPALAEIKELMSEIDTGGWQEAYTGLARLKEIGERHTLPNPDHHH